MLLILLLTIRKLCMSNVNRVPPHSVYHCVARHKAKLVLLCVYSVFSTVIVSRLPPPPRIYL